MSVKVRERPKDSGVWWIFIDHQGKRRAKKIGRDLSHYEKICLFESILDLDGFKK